jgi:hypothetical protein
VRVVEVDEGVDVVVAGTELGVGGEEVAVVGATPDVAGASVRGGPVVVGSVVVVLAGASVVDGRVTAATVVELSVDTGRVAEGVGASVEDDELSDPVDRLTDVDAAEPSPPEPLHAPATNAKAAVSARRRRLTMGQYRRRRRAPMSIRSTAH